MEQRNVSNKEELRSLIVETILNKKEAFTATEIVENILDNKLFNYYCSTIQLIQKVTESIDILFEVGAIKWEKGFPEGSTEVYIVCNIT